MARGERLITIFGPARVIAATGGLFVALGVSKAVLDSAAGEPIAEALIDVVLIGVPGAGLLYGGYWLARSGLHQDVQPRVVAWCLGGLSVMLGVVVLLVLNPTGNVDRPFRAAMIAAAIGGIGGLAIGVNQGRAYSRAREAEEHRDELRRERDLREHILETSPVGIMIIDDEGVVTRANHHVAEIFGVTPDKFIGSGYDEVAFEVADPDGNLVPGDLRRHILSKGEALYNVERQIFRDDGVRTWLSISGAPLHGPAGEPAAVVFAIEDITERKRLEADLRDTVDRLERSNDQLRQFAYAASHDLQEPLRMVSSYLQLLDNRYRDDLDSDAREFIEFAVDGADRMRKMINALLQYARVEQAGAAFERVDCAAVMERILTGLQVQIEETDADIVTGPLPTVNADEQQLEQLFQNVVSNALKYSGDGAPTIEIAARQRDGYWEFSVADNGIGIAPDKTDQIFEVFKRLHGDNEYPGTGIGLSLCRKIVERHGGDIWVESEPGDGSTFYFTIPTAEKQWSAPATRPEPPGEQNRGVTN